MSHQVIGYAFGSRVARLAVFGVAIILGNAQADTVPLYTVTEITGIIPSTSSSALNDLGQIAGTTRDDVAAIWSSGVVTSIGMVPGAIRSYGMGINDFGQVAGSSILSASVWHGFLYSNGIMTDIGTLPGGTLSGGNAINDLGQVVGPASGGAFLYANGAMMDLGFSGFPTAINNSGQIVGIATVVSGDTTHAFLYSNGIFTDLGTLPGVGFSSAFGINNSGQIVGDSGHAFLYSNGVMTDLGTLPGTVPGTSYSYATGINDCGQVVGNSYLSSTPAHAFIYSDGAMMDLNSLIDASLNITLTDATSINNLGQIVASGIRADSYNDSFYLLTPVPEPSVWLLCACGLIALAAVRCWRNQSHPRQPSGRK